MASIVIHIKIMIVVLIILSQICYGRYDIQINAYQFISELTELIRDDSIENQCITKLKTSFNNFLSDPTAITFIKYSGKSTNDLGMYYKCLNTTGFTYVGFSLSLEHAFYFSNIGLCSPIECNASFYSNYKPLVAQIFNKLQTFLNVSTDMIEFTDVQQANRAITKVTNFKIAGILVLILLLTFCIVSTVIERYISGTPNKIQRVCQCFSMSKNLSAIFYSKNRVDANLDVFNGIKVLSCGWVILGHTFGQSLMGGPLMNFSDMNDVFSHSFSIAVIANAQVSVDVFFMISGFLAAMGYAKVFSDKSKLNIKVVLMSYLRRYLRLLPIYICLLLYSLDIFDVIADGPVYYQSRFEISSVCSTKWWANLLFINNFFAIKNICFFWTWYMANEFQFFLISAWIGWAYAKSKKSGCLIVISIMIASLGVTIFLSYWYGLTYFYSNSLDTLGMKYNYYNVVYYRPYTRIPPYLIGILAAWGYLAHKEEQFSYPIWNRINSFIHNRLYRYITYVLGFIFINVLLFSYSIFNTKPERITKTIDTLFIVFEKPLFIIALLMVVYPILIGHGKPLLAVLGHQIFNALSKLTYSMYMLHLLLFSYYEYTSEQLIEFSSLFMVLIGMDVFVGAILIGIIGTLMFDSPMLQIEKQFLFPDRKPKICDKLDEETNSINVEKDANAKIN